MVDSTTGIPDPAVPWRFVLVAVVVAALVAVAVYYFGSRGYIGGGIPGQKSANPDVQLPVIPLIPFPLGAALLFPRGSHPPDLGVRPGS
jgi:hypothetical protein